MIKVLLIAFPCVGIYIGIALAVYAVLNKIDPYDEATDYWGDGDGNKAVALFWPLGIPVSLILAAIEGLLHVMDLIQKHGKGDNNG